MKFGPNGSRHMSTSEALEKHKRTRHMSDDIKEDFEANALAIMATLEWSANLLTLLEERHEAVQQVVDTALAANDRKWREKALLRHIDALTERLEGMADEAKAEQQRLLSNSAGERERAIHARYEIKLRALI